MVRTKHQDVADAGRQREHTRAVSPALGVTGLGNGAGTSRPSCPRTLRLHADVSPQRPENGHAVAPQVGARACTSLKLARLASAKLPGARRAPA